MGFQLVILRGRSDVKVHRLGPGVTVAGRQDGCQLQVKSSQVSRRHCEFFEQKGRLIVKDLGSSNGTFVNGEKIDGQQALESGDEILIGGVKFRVEQATGKPGDTAVPAAPVAAVDSDDDGMIPVEDEPTIMAAPAPKAPARKPEPVEEEVEVEADEEASGGPELGEDAVADFLLDLDLDDDDKK